MQSTDSTTRHHPNSSGLFTLALRLVVGWTYFSAFWRRVALENKLDPEVAGYIGEKFNHFLPHALGIKPLIEYLVLNPDALWWSDAGDRIIAELDGEGLAAFPAAQIHNHYVAKIRPGRHSMVLPLGAKADIHWQHPALTALPNGTYRVLLTDISGATWQAGIER